MDYGKNEDISLRVVFFAPEFQQRNGIYTFVTCYMIWKLNVEIKQNKTERMNLQILLYLMPENTDMTTAVTNQCRHGFAATHGLWGYKANSFSQTYLLSGI